MSRDETPDTTGLREVWLPVRGYEGRYEVSSLGRVKSLPRPRARGGILTPWLRAGYPTVSLSGRMHSVHRLIAETFIPGSAPVVRHLNDVKTDNRVDNLAWGSYSENSRDAVANGLNRESSKTECSRGHVFSEENTRWYRGTRRCRECERRQVVCPECGETCHVTHISRHRRRKHAARIARHTPEDGCGMSEHTAENDAEPCICGTGFTCLASEHDGAAS